MSDVETLWGSLLEGDPGPSLAFVDLLLNNDLPFAAGGVLRDLAERMVDAGSSIEDDNKCQRFVEAVNRVLRHAYREDPDALQDLLDEVA